MTSMITEISLKSGLSIEYLIQKSFRSEGFLSYQGLQQGTYQWLLAETETFQ